MKISSCDRRAPLLFALLLMGCSSSHGSQQAAATAPVAPPQSVSPTPAPTVTAPSTPAAPDDAPPAEAGGTPASAMTTGAPSASQSAAAESNTSGPVQPATPQPNQADQATLARQSEVAMEVPGTAPASPSNADTHATLATHAEVPAHIHGASLNTTHVAAVTQLNHHMPPLTQVAVTPVAHATTTPTIQQAAALRRAKFTSLASRFNAPVQLSSGDIGAHPPKVMMLKIGDIGISNFDDVARVNFALKTSDSDWSNDYLDPRDSQDFACGLAGECLFWMQTGDQDPVYYTMHHDSRYAIFWDPQKQIWDLRIAVLEP